MHFVLLWKVPVKQLPQVPQQGPVMRAARLQGFFCLHISEIPYSNSYKKFILSLIGPRKVTFHFSPKSGPLEKQMSTSRALLSIYSESPVKELPLLLSLTEFPQREMAHSYSPPSSIFQSPQYSTPLPGYPAGPLERERFPSTEPFLHNLQGSQ